MDAEFDGDDDDTGRFVRNYITVTMLREALGGHPVLRGLHSPDNVIGRALQMLEGWEKCGPKATNRLGRKLHWWARVGLDNGAEYVPVEAIRGVGADANEPEEDDILS